VPLGDLSSHCLASPCQLSTSALQSVPANPYLGLSFRQSTVRTWRLARRPVSFDYRGDCRQSLMPLSCCRLHLVASHVELVATLFEPVLCRLDLSLLVTNPLSQQVGSPQRSCPCPGFGRPNQSISLAARHGIARMRCNRQPQPTIGWAVEANQGSLVTEANGIVHPAKGGAGIGRAGTGYGTTCQIAVVD